MAAPYNPPVKNEDFVFYMALPDMSVPGRFKQNPTIAAGDFQISKDGGAFANLGTLPSADPSGSEAVKITLTSTEMNADNVAVRARDQTSPPEWADVFVNIVTTSA